MLHRRLADAADLAGSSGGLDDLGPWWHRSTGAEHLPAYRVLFEILVRSGREPERYERFLQRSAHDALALAERLVVAEGFPGDRAPAIATMIVAQARGLQLDLLTTGDRERVDRAFSAFTALLDRLRLDWSDPPPPARLH